MTEGILRYKVTDSETGCLLIIYEETYEEAAKNISKQKGCQEASPREAKS
jgi:hypothetical protein